MRVEDLTKEIFMELLRSYHNNIDISSGFDWSTDVVHNLTKEAYFMAMEYRRTIDELLQ